MLEVIDSWVYLVQNIEFTNNKPTFEVNGIKTGKEAFVKIKRGNYSYE